MDTSPPPARDPGRSIGLRNWRVRSKLIAVLVIPAVAFLVLASFGIGSLVGNAQAFEEGRSLAELGRQVTALVHELQAERDLSVAFTASADKGVGNALSEQQPRVNQAVAAYREAEAPLYDDLGDRMRAKFDAVRAGLDDLAALRESARTSSLTGRAIEAEYSRIIDWLLDVNTDIAAPGGDEDLSQSVGSFNDLSRAKEVTSQVRGILYGLAFRKSFEFGGFQDFSGLLAQQQSAFEEFQADANDQQRGLFADTVQGQAVLQVNRIQQDVIRRQSGDEIDAGQWLAASTTNMELLRSVESRLLEGIIAQSGDLSSTAQRDALRNALVIAVILGVALLALLLVARSMARPLQQLRVGAIEIAEHRLPDAVQRLRTTERGDLDVQVEPHRDQLEGRDRPGRPGVQRRPGDRRSGSPSSRPSCAAASRDVFLSLARRSQALLHRQLALLDAMERRATDPEELERAVPHRPPGHPHAPQRREPDRALRRRPPAGPGAAGARGRRAPRRAAPRSRTTPGSTCCPRGRLAARPGRRRRRDPPAGRADRERGCVLAAANRSASAARWSAHGFAIEIEDRGLGHERRGAGAGQRAAAQPAGVQAHQHRRGWACTWSASWPSATASRCSCATPGTAG